MGLSVAPRGLWIEDLGAANLDGFGGCGGRSS